MNTSRKISLLFLFVSLFSMGLWAQRATPTITGDNELIELLQLTPEQAAEIEALEAETETKMAVHREAGTAARDEAKDTRQAHSRALNSILTEEQQNQLRSYRMGQRTDRREAMKAVDWEGMRAELKTHQETKVEPVMRAQRAKLESKLSKDDRETLTAIQEELAAIRTEGRGNRQEELEEAEAPAETVDKPGRRRARQGKGAAASQLDMDARAQAATLAAKYGDDINELFAEITPQREQWEAEKAAIRANYLPDSPAKRGERLDAGDEKIEQRNITFLLMKTEK